jgi:hypothetical protein
MDWPMPYSPPALSLGLRLKSRRVRSDRPQRLGRLPLAVIALAAVVGFVGSTWRPDARVDTPLPMPQTTDEQRYADALWPIHTQLEQTVARVGLGAAVYQSRDIDSRELKARLSQGLASYRRAGEQVAALQPPPALRTPHREYLTAVRLFEQSTLEMLRMYEDGDEEHLSSALPLTLDGTKRLRDVSGQVWPDDVPPG